MRRLRAGANVAPRTREASGFRLGPLWGSATVCWLDGDRRAARNRQEPRPRKNGPRLKDRRGGAPRGVAVCLCFPAIREIRRGLLKVRLSAFRLPLFFARARPPEPPTHVKQFAGGDDAWPEEGERCRDGTL